jgi:hypothetical protein
VRLHAPLRLVAPHRWPDSSPASPSDDANCPHPPCTIPLQGWSKFASNLFYTTETGALVVAAWAPASATLSLPGVQRRAPAQQHSPTQHQPSAQQGYPPLQHARRLSAAAPKRDRGVASAPKIDGDPAAALGMDVGYSAASGAGLVAAANVKIEVETDYPFGDSAIVTVTVPGPAEVTEEQADGGEGQGDGVRGQAAWVGDQAAKVGKPPAGPAQAASRGEQEGGGVARARRETARASGGVAVMLRIPSWADAATVNGEETVAGARALPHTRRASACADHAVS